MLINLLIGILVMVFCLFLQLFVLIALVRHYRHWSQRLPQSLWSEMAEIKNITLALILGNMVQIGIWAGVFMVLGEFGSFETAFYHSAVNFATLGYGDVVMSERYRLLGPIEAVNGVVMIGISTAVLMLVLQNAKQRVLGK